MKLLQEFKEFAMKGNVVDLAVGLVIGAAFGKIVSSLVADVIMPPLGLMIGGINFSEMGWTLKDAVVGADGNVTTPAVVLAYGKFLQVVFDFLIVAAAIFGVIKLMNEAKRRMERKAEVAPEAPEVPADIKLLTEIRDELRSRPTGAV
ncbi:MAG: large-conductance mechanosensitive channel protein MscL [Planctomycetaceae bacterium]